MLSIIIPCYNEQDVIKSTVDGLLQENQTRKIETEFVLVNNNSSDNTLNVLNELAAAHENIKVVSTPPTPGYGVACRWGIYYATGEFVLITMADASESPNEVFELYEKTLSGNFDFGFGSRFCADAVVTDYPKLKLLLNRLGNRLISNVVGIKYDDFTNGFKCFRREKLELMQPLISQEFNLTVEMAMKAVGVSKNFCVMPTSWKDREVGESKFKLLRQCRLYISTIRYCIRQRKLRSPDWDQLIVLPKRN